MFHAPPYEVNLQKSSLPPQPTNKYGVFNEVPILACSQQRRSAAAQWAETCSIATRFATPTDSLSPSIRVESRAVFVRAKRALKKDGSVGPAPIAHRCGTPTPLAVMLSCLFHDSVQLYIVLRKYA